MANLSTSEPLLSTYPNVERAVSFVLQSEQLLPVEYSISVFRHPSFLSTAECEQLTLQENEPRFDLLPFWFPSYDREHSSDHVLVRTAEFLMNFRTHQICLSCTDSDSAILRQETETIHVSSFQLLLHSQPVGLGLGLLFELLSSGAHRPC